MNNGQIVERINALRKERNAVILAHNYCRPEVQDIADFVGDSLGLAIKATKTDADVIVFCGVTFMAETAKILNPSKTVLMAEPEAFCVMAQMCTPEQIEGMKAKHPGAEAVGYVNSTARCKTRLDVCCTSSNAVGVVSGLKSKDVIIIPDMNLGRYVAGKCPEKNIILWDGFCPMHQFITVRQVEALRAAYPDALIIAHPECRKEVLDMADEVGSTEKIIGLSRESPPPGGHHNPDGVGDEAQAGEGVPREEVPLRRQRLLHRDEDDGSDVSARRAGEHVQPGRPGR